MAPTALVTGAAGQDGVLLARHLVAEGYRVVGSVQPGAAPPLKTYLAGVDVVEHDVRDQAGFERLLEEHRPDEIYNLAGFTSVAASWAQADLVADVNAAAVERMLDSVIRFGAGGKAPRFFQASSSEVYGPSATNPQDEATPHAPRNPYAESKSRAQAAVTQRRDHDGLFASVGILYNHESQLRGAGFVTRKITRAAAEIAEGRRDSVVLGNLTVSRDWGAARDYVVAMHRALQHDEPQDYVIATGQLHSLGDLLEVAFEAAGVADPWSYVEQDPALLRSADSPGLAGDARRAEKALGWSPTTSFAQVIEEMVDVDRRRVRSGVEEDVSYLPQPTA